MTIELHQDSDQGFYDAFQKRRPMPKKEVMKIPAMTFIRVKWNDAPDEVVLLLDKPEYQAGTVGLHTVRLGGASVDWMVGHEQVLSVVGPCIFPE